MKLSRKNNQGMTLIELAFVVAIGSLIILGAVMSYSGMKDSKTAENFANNIQKMRIGITKLYQAKGNYSGLTNATIRTNDDIVVPNLTDGTTGSNIKTPWSLTGTGVAVAPVASNSRFTITLSGIESDSCEKLAQFLWPQRYETMTINGTTITGPELIAANCNAAGTPPIVLTSY